MYKGIIVDKCEQTLTLADDRNIASGIIATSYRCLEMTNGMSERLRNQNKKTEKTKGKHGRPYPVIIVNVFYLPIIGGKDV